MDEFLKRMGELFECVLFTASLAKVCKYFSVLCGLIFTQLRCELL